MLKMKITVPRSLPHFPTIYIRNVRNEDVIMVSFDVTSLYMNIPIIDMLNIIKDYVNDDQFTRKTAVSQDKFLGLVHLVLRTTWYTFDSQFYQQIDGVAMGGPASSQQKFVCRLINVLQ